jgi:hypothetical protein
MSGVDENVLSDAGIAGLTEADLLDLDKSGSGMGKDELKELLRQLVDVRKVRSINLSSNKLGDDSAEDLAALVTLDRPKLPTDLVTPAGFIGLDVSFNDLGPAAADRVFKFGVLHNHLRYLHIEGNLSIAIEPTMGSSIADWVKAGAVPGGPNGIKKSGPAGAKKRGKDGASTTMSAGANAILAKANAGKLIDLRVTLFDFNNIIVDQNPLLALKDGKKKKGTAKAAPVRAKGKGAKGAATSTSGLGPMNALGFVRSLLGGGTASTTAKKGTAGAKKAARPAAAKKKATGSKGAHDSKGHGLRVLQDLYDMIFDESPEDFEANIPPTLEGAALDTPVSGEMKDTLLCHAVRHNKVEHVRILLERKASPTAPNGGSIKTSPLQLAKFTGRQEIYGILREAAKESKDAGDDLLGLAPAPFVKPAVTSLGLVHAKLHKDTITHLATHMRGLTALDISGGFIGADGARLLAENLTGKAATLLSLNVSSNSIGCTGVALLSNMLSFNDTLTHLDVSSNDIGDAGAKAIGRGLRDNATLACICVGDNPISGEGVRRLLKIARECENLVSLKGSDQLLAPVKLRTMVENNAEGRVERVERAAGEAKTGGSSDEEDEEEEEEELREITKASSSLIAAQMKGGEWDCLKSGQVSFNSTVRVSCNVKLAKVSVGGVKKPVNGFTLCLSRKRFGLGWQMVETGKSSGDNFGTWKRFEWNLENSLAGDEIALWIRVEPLGRGEVGGICRDWKLELVGGGGNVGGGRQFRDGGGQKTVWN